MPMVTLRDRGLEAGVWHPPSASGVTYLFALGARKSLEKEGRERRSVSEEDQASLLLRLCGRSGCVAEQSRGELSGKYTSLSALKEAARADPKEAAPLSPQHEGHGQVAGGSLASSLDRGTNAGHCPPRAGPSLLGSCCAGRWSGGCCPCGLGV